MIEINNEMEKILNVDMNKGWIMRNLTLKKAPFVHLSVKKGHPFLDAFLAVSYNCCPCQ